MGRNSSCLFQWKLYSKQSLFWGGMCNEAEGARYQKVGIPNSYLIHRKLVSLSLFFFSHLLYLKQSLQVRESYFISANKTLGVICLNLLALQMGGLTPKKFMWDVSVPGLSQKWTLVIWSSLSCSFQLIVIHSAIWATF